MIFLLLLPIVLVDPVAFDYHAIKYVGAIAGAAVAVGIALTQKRFAWTNVSLALWIFVGVRGLMLLHSPMPGQAVRWWGLLLALTCAHHALPAPGARTTRLVGGVLVVLSVVALVQYLFGAKQAQALFAHRNFAGAGFAMLLPFLLALDARLLPVGLLGLFATQSRGGALAAGAALALWFAWHRPRWRLPLMIGVPAVVLAGALLLGESNTVKVRLAWYRAALEIGLDAPLTGEGAGGFAREYPPRRPIEEHRISGGDRVHAVHNDYLESFAEGGVGGLLAHLLLLGFLLRAARHDRVAACSLVAFATASLVDLPLRDPALLALAFVPVARIAVRRPLPSWTAAPALVASLVFLPLAWGHWRADHDYGRFLESEDRADLDRALEHEPRHREALMHRGRESDLQTLLETEPHHAGALYNLTEHVFKQDAITALEAILLKHDPHHALTRVRLATLLMDDDPLAAASILDDAIDADPRPWLPHAVLARIHRKAGRLEQAEVFLREAEYRTNAVAVRRERLDLELAKWKGRVTEAARRMPTAEIRQRIEIAFARAAAIEEQHPRPRIKREPDESDTEFAARVQIAQEQWASELLGLTRADYTEAADLATALVVNGPTAPHFRLLARAERSRRNRKTADHAEGFALFLESLDHLIYSRRREAGDLLVRALRTNPGLLDDESVPQAIRMFLKAHPEARDAARDLFRPHPPFAKAVEDG